jgi:SAM-dependent methyltransferase
MNDRRQHKPRLCPWWVGYLLILPTRRRTQNPVRILGPYVREGMTVLEVGPGMGYFSLPLARLVGQTGKVICVDVQKRMLRKLERRAIRAGLMDRIVPVHAAEDSLRIDGYEGRVDFALAFSVVHEAPDQAGLMAQIHRALKPGGLLLFSEPGGHISQAEFDDSVEIAKAAGFTVKASVDVKRARSVVLERPGGG